MSLAIPNDPSLALGSIVNQEVLDKFKKIGSLQREIDAAHDKMNSFISLKRSFEMTTQELISMKVDLPAELPQRILELNESIAKAAVEYATIKIEKEEEIYQIKLLSSHNYSQLESPVDYSSTKIKSLPLSVDSLKMDSQYFSFDENKNNSSTKENIKQYISNATIGTAGKVAATDISNHAVSQIDKQTTHHEIAGTLIITATCTHKNAAILSPLVLDADKAITIWNNMFRAEQDKINPNDIDSLQGIIDEQGTNSEKSISIISGAIYGSCFVGMIHVLKDASTITSEDIADNNYTIEEDRWQNLFRKARYMAAEEGKLGIDESDLEDIKSDIFSKKRVSSHINVITVGAIPSIKSSEVKTGIEILGNSSSVEGKIISSSKENKNLATIHSESISNKEKSLLNSVANSRIKSMMFTLSKIEEEKNKNFDINSMVNLFENYVNKITAGTSADKEGPIIGSPISYYTRPIKRSEIVQLYVDKYFPKASSNISINNNKTETRKEALETSKQVS